MTIPPSSLASSEPATAVLLRSLGAPDEESMIFSRRLPVRLAAALMSVTAAGTELRADEATGPTALDRAGRARTYELTLAHMRWKTSGPFTGWTKNFRKNPIPYRMDVAMLTVAQPLSSRRPILRNIEFLRSVVWSSITRGPENHWGGAALGFRYNLALPRLPRASLFGSFQGGVGAIDASGQKYAQTKDLTFVYLAAVGVRTRLTDTVSLHAQVLGQHISNGWQTRPSEGIDCSGFSLAISYRPNRQR